MPQSFYAILETSVNDLNWMVIYSRMKPIKAMRKMSELL